MGDEIHFEELLQDKNFHNWVRVMYAMQTTTEAMKDRLLEEFSSIFPRVKSLMNKIPPCCTRTSAGDCFQQKIYRSLCSSCAKRIVQLQSHMKRHVINWEVECSVSGTTPENKEELLYIFLRVASNCKGAPTFESMLGDISCLCQVLSVCGFFSDSDGERKMLELKNLRDSWAHKKGMFKKAFSICETNRNLCFQIMHDLFDAKLMQPASVKYRALLKQIEDTDIERAIVVAGIGNLSLQLDNIHDVSTEQLAASANNQAMLKEIVELVKEVLKSRQASQQRIDRKRALSFILVIVVVCLCLIGGVYFLLTMKELEPFPTLGCPNEENQFLKFRLHYKDHGTGHLRSWIYQDVIDAITSPHTSAVLLLANEGYGLSYMTKQLVCADKTASTEFHLKKQLLAYHICRFNYLETQSSENMIRNLMVMMKRQMPNYKNYVYGNEEDIKRSLDRCGKDVFTCFRDVIKIPLHSVGDHQQMIIIVDALDECGTDLFSVFRLLQTILTDNDLKLPDWVKFVLTSADRSFVIENMVDRRIKHLRLYNFDPRHIQVLRSYTMEKSGLLLKNRKQCVENIVKAADGSFLCLDEDWESLLLNCEYRSYDRNSSCLDRKFTAMFDRTFSADTAFQSMRPLLEVLAVSYNPLRIGVYRDIAVKNGIGMDYDLPRILRSTDYFLRITSEDKLVFRHEYIKKWLISPERRGRPYFVVEKNGHKTLAEYFLNKNFMDDQNEVKPVDLARHVILSAEKELVNEFKSRYQNQLESDYKMQWNEILQGKFDRANSEALITLLLLHSESASLDGLAFNASVTNESTVLYTLLQLGADSMYTAKLPEIWTEYKNKTRIVTIDDGFWNMLQIAARYGLLTVLDTLMKHDEYLVYEKHPIEGNAFQIAMKYQGESVTRRMLQNNPKLASMDSLLFAAEEGFSKIVQLLLKSGAPNKCVDCNNTVTWFDKDRFYLEDKSDVIYSLQNISSNQSDRDIFVREIDNDIWKLTCITPLEVAIINNHFNVFRMLLDDNPMVAYCQNFRGHTPIITAARFNRLNMFSYLLDLNNITEGRCKTFNYESRNALVRILCADENGSKLCRQQGGGLSKWTTCCPSTSKTEDQVSRVARHGSMLDVHQRSKQIWNFSAYMYYATCRDSSFQSLYELALCGEILPYSKAKEIRFDDRGICLAEPFLLRESDVTCHATSDSHITIMIKKSFRNRHRSFGHLLRYSVVSGQEKYRIADFPSYLKMLQGMSEQNTEVPWACYCNKFHRKVSENLPNSTSDLTHMYSWHVEGMTFLKFPRLFFLCQQYYIFQQVTKDNPWRTMVKSNTQFHPENGNNEPIRLLELPYH